MEYPIFNSKILMDGNEYDLVNTADRLRYFHAKLGTKIDDVKEFIEHNSFIGYLLAKKQAGKGTYAKMIQEILGEERFVHISVGDVVRQTHASLEDPIAYEELRKYLQKHYRGFLSIDESLYALRNRSQEKISIPTEFLLCLLKREIEKIGKKALFLDGLPRNMDQISYSLYFRDLINFRDDPDFFVLINVSREVIDTRMRMRRVCPVCSTSKNLYFNPSDFTKYEPLTDEYYFLCDNKSCSGYGKAKLELKEGDAEGIKSIEARIKGDEDLMKSAMNLQGIPLVLVEGAVPYNRVTDYLEPYEVQSMYEYSHDSNNNVIVNKKPWVFKDDENKECCTMYAATYVVNIFIQLHKILLG
jgi:adenylate kinase family enzyme